jgi:hypothetical protein
MRGSSPVTCLDSLSSVLLECNLHCCSMSCPVWELSCESCPLGMPCVVCVFACVGALVSEYVRVVVFTTVGRDDVDSPSRSSIEFIVALFVVALVVFIGSVVALVFLFMFLSLFVRLALVVYIPCVYSCEL